MFDGRIGVTATLLGWSNHQTLFLLNQVDFVSFEWDTKSKYARRLRGFDLDPDDYSLPTPV
jgi:hypothetical protein